VDINGWSAFKMKIMPDEKNGPRPRQWTARKISRGTLHEEVALQLQDMILVGELAPGRVIPEMELCQALGISRTPLREALKVLASDNLVELHPGRGAIVVEPTADDVMGTLYAIGAIEGACALLACSYITPRELQHIQQLHSRMVAAHKSGDRLKYFQFNQRIHERIVAASRNEFLANLHAKLNMRVRRIRFLGKSEISWWDQAVAEHEEILHHLEQRNGPALAELVREHMIQLWNDVKHTF
jgi:DNA-binding GntR family transcriptional regulator